MPKPSTLSSGLVIAVVAGAATVALAAGFATRAQAADGLITCWYNEKNAYTGADTAQPGYPPGLKKTDISGDYTWAYTIRAPDGTKCPRTRPQS